MRLAAIYDIHGNLPALEVVLADAQDLYAWGSLHLPLLF